MATTTIIIESISRETEKAILVNVMVSFAGNAPKSRDLWFPKSVVVKQNGQVMEVKDWFVRKVENENAFKGYRMEILKPISC